MKIKTSELTDLALDWAVAFCQNQTLGTEQYNVLAPLEEGQEKYSPSTNGSQGVEIIERECMASSCFAPLPDSLHYDPANPTRKQWFFWTGKTGMVAGPTLLIAAMRCYVASKLGDEVDVPEELVP